MVMQMCHDEGGNPNIHTRAYPGGPIANNRGTSLYAFAGPRIGE